MLATLNDNALERSLLEAMAENPEDISPWFALCDLFDETGDERIVFAKRRLYHYDHKLFDESLEEMEAKVQALLARGILPPVPTETNSIGMTFVLIPAGGFLMGSPETEKHRSDNEGPQHWVEIKKAFWLSKYPTTQAQWQAVMGSNPSAFSKTGSRAEQVKDMDTRDFPVESVSWYDAVEFCKKLSVMDGKERRLPTEEEWEYACRSGALVYQVFHCGNSLSSYQANFNGRYPYGDAEKGPCLGRTCKVGSYLPNAFGLYDMHGNVWEWCADWYKPYRSGEQRADPTARSRVAVGTTMEGTPGQRAASGTVQNSGISSTVSDAEDEQGSDPSRSSGVAVTSTSTVTLDQQSESATVRDPRGGHAASASEGEQSQRPTRSSEAGHGGVLTASSAPPADSEASRAQRSPATVTASDAEDEDSSDPIASCEADHGTTTPTVAVPLAATGASQASVSFTTPSALEDEDSSDPTRPSEAAPGYSPETVQWSDSQPMRLEGRSTTASESEGKGNSRRVSRGGCWFYYGLLCRPAFRGEASPEGWGVGLGFRVS